MNTTHKSKIRKVLHNSVTTVDVIYIKANWGVGDGCGGEAVYSVYISRNNGIKNKCENIGCEVTTKGFNSRVDSESKTIYTHGSNSQRFRSYEFKVQ